MCNTSVTVKGPGLRTSLHSAVKRLFIWRLLPFITRFYLLKGVYLVFIVNSVYLPFVTSVK